MGLSDKKKLFFQIRAKCEIIVKSHAFRDYPERGFSKAELINLVRINSGRVVENKSPEAIEESFLFLVKDDLNRECKLVLLIEEVEVVDDQTSVIRKDTIIVCSAFRKIESES